eukprot:9322236-Pyramimonas_sp.AAC.1
MSLYRRSIQKQSNNRQEKILDHFCVRLLVWILFHSSSEIRLYAGHARPETGPRPPARPRPVYQRPVPRPCAAPPAWRWPAPPSWQGPRR